MTEIKFDLTAFEDIATYGWYHILDALNDSMKVALNEGTFIVIERRYCNAESDTIQTISTLDDLTQFINAFRR